MFPVDPTTTIPKNLKTLHPHPDTPWQISASLFARFSQPSSTIPEAPYKKCEILDTDPEAKFVKAYFEHQKPPGYTISKVFCLHNPALSKKFVADLESINEEAKTYKPEWEKEDLKSEREKVITRWKEQANLFYPVSIPRETRTDTLFNVRVLPLWHGTSTTVCHSIASSGFTFFGKHHFFNPDAKPGSFKSTDAGYFGSGIYFTNSAKYASLYNSGQLLMAWVAMREPFPVINNVPHPKKGKDMNMLYGKPAYQTYNAHYIPVAPISDTHGCIEYYPCYQNQAPACDEFVVFQKTQPLPRFWVELTVDFFPQLLSPSSPSSAPLPSSVATLPPTTTAATPPNITSKTPSSKATLPTTTATTSNPPLSKHPSTPKNSPSSKKKTSSPPIPAAEPLDLCSACALGDLEFVKKEVKSWLIKKTTRINQPNPQGDPPLHLAIQNGHFEIAEFLLNNEANPQLFDSKKYQPLHWACKEGNIRLVQLLVKFKAPLNSPGLYQRTPLHMAAHNGRAAVVAWLISMGASINAQADQNDNLTTPLHDAILREHLGVVQTLCSDAQLNVNLADANQHTPLYYAVVSGQLEIVQLLTRHLSWKNPSHPTHPNHTSQLLKLTPFKNGAAIQAYLQTLEKTTSSYQPEKKQ